MTRHVLYVAAPLRPTEEEIESHRHAGWMGPLAADEMVKLALQANIDRALRWLAWLRKSFLETTFIAPWIACVVSRSGDGTPEEREAGMVDDCAVVERCDGIVLCGGRISSGMRREMEHGMSWRVFDGDDGEPARFEVYDLTDTVEIADDAKPVAPGVGFHDWCRILGVIA
jgi:hypothetical protein